jgi:hypothetical protein
VVPTIKIQEGMKKISLSSDISEDIIISKMKTFKEELSKHVGELLIDHISWCFPTKPYWKNTVTQIKIGFQQAQYCNCKINHSMFILDIFLDQEKWFITISTEASFLRFQ